jgi:aromatic-L-amino-acid/L-tryptophan decarboxylase
MPKSKTSPDSRLKQRTSISEAYLDEFRQAAQESIEWIVEYLRDSRKYPVVSQIKPGDLIDALPKSAPESGEDYKAMLADLDRIIIPAITHWNHPRFMAFFSNSGTAPGVIGEMLAAAINTNGLHWKTSPAISELEQVTLDWLRQWMGLEEGWFGIIYDTASVSSLHAIAAAREIADPEARIEGMRPGMTLYASEQAHSSIEKGAITLGIGQKNVRKVPVDNSFQMRPEALRDMILKDKQEGKRPFCVVATVGTTSTTSVDPVPQIAEICEEFGLWLHVDAAYAGIAAVAPQYQHIFKGIERAHSLVVNPHKWMFTPVDLSAFYTKKPDILRRAFSLVPEYLRVAGAPREVNYMDYGVPLGRRFRALKLWFIMRYFGREAIARMIQNHIAWAQEFAEWVRVDSRFDVMAPTPFSTVCFRYRGSDDENRAIHDKVNASGKLYISQTSLHGQVVLRIAIGNMGTTHDDVRAAWEVIKTNL